MKRLWIAVIVIATFGSLYPFDFQPRSIDAELIHEFLGTCCVLTGRGDIIGNTILFLPFGFVGMFAIRPETSALQRLALLVLIGAIFATLLQIGQIYLPSRDESLQDVFWNVGGTIIGAALAYSAARRITESTDLRLTVEIGPMVLIVSWLTYRLIPFVPSIDLHLWSDSVKPLMAFRLEPLNVAHDLTAWLVIAYFLRWMRRDCRSELILPALILAVFTLEVLIVDNALYPNNLLGALLAILIWPVLLRTQISQDRLLIALLFVIIAASGMTPFAISDTTFSFNWVPFHGFLSGSMQLNASSAAEKVFLYGSLVLLLQKAGPNRLLSTSCVFCFVLLIELAQTRVVGHTPEITDPLIVVLAGAGLILLDREARLVSGRFRSLARSRHRGIFNRRGSADPRRQSGRWVAQSINLHGDQLVFLQELAQEMGVSVSCATRRIVTTVIDEVELEAESSESPLDPQQLATLLRLRLDAGREAGPHDWVRVTVNLRRENYQWLSGVASALGMSVSRVTRRLLAAFIKELAGEAEVIADT